MSISANYGPRRRGSRASRRFGAHEKGVTFFDTAEVYGPYAERGTGRRGARARPRQGDDRHQVRVRHPGAPTQSPVAAGSTAAPTRIKKVVEGVAQAPAHRPHRPLLPAPRRPEGADRGCGRCGQGAHQARQGAALRALGSGRRERSAVRMPCSRSRQSRPNIRSGRGPEQNGVLKTCEELGIGFVPWGPLGDGLPDRAR